MGNTAADTVSQGYFFVPAIDAPLPTEYCFVGNDGLSLLAFKMSAFKCCGGQERLFREKRPIPF
jgi:hypothetical protein